MFSFIPSADFIPHFAFLIQDIHFGLIETDPDDNKFVDCAVAADAENIVTNDSHFNILKQIDWPKITVITIKEFYETLK